MSDADDKLVICNQVLGEIGTRSTMTSVDPPDGSTEAYYCNLLFNNTRDTLLRAANWNFAARTDALALWKALPGTPENPGGPPGFLWNVRYPAPPWLYSYSFPFANSVQIRRVRQQDMFLGSAFDAIPLYGGANVLSASYNQMSYAAFEVATDTYDAAGVPLNMTYFVASVNPLQGGSGYLAGDLIRLFVPPPPDVTGQHAACRVTGIDANGGVTAVTILNSGTFSDNSTVQLYQSTTSGVGTGFVCEVSFKPNLDTNSRVILTNARDAVIDFTTNDVVIAQWDAGFQNAFMSALEGKLALSLLGDKAMAKLKLEQANNDILEARVRDGNEALTVYDHIPDWLQVRGVASMGSPWVNPPYYGPLFAV